jgi:DNA-binding CsgD family transcriptional regulator
VLYRHLGDDHGLAAVLRDLGGYWKGHGDGTEARACLEESMAVAERTGDAAVVAGAASYLGTVAAYADDRTLARHWLEQCLRVLPLQGGSDEATRSEFFLACLDCDDGDTRSARARLTRLMALEEVQSLPYTAGFALDGVARLAGAEGQPAKAMRLAGAAAARHEALGTSAGPAYDAFVHRGLSWARAVLGPERADRAEAQGRQLTMADAVAEGLRPAQPTLAARPDLAGLSEREAEVLRCAADGLSDRDIADRLRLSRRTVGNHLGSVYRKLGVASRTAAIRAGRDRGLLD